jgi:hypothetical protein
MGADYHPFARWTIGDLCAQHTVNAWQIRRALR